MCMFAPVLDFRAADLSTCLGYSHDPLLDVVTLAWSTYDFTTQTQPKNDHRDFNNGCTEVKRCGQGNMDLASYCQTALFLVPTHSAIHTEWLHIVSILPLFLVSIHTCIKQVSESSQVQSETVALKNSVKKCHFYKTLLYRETPL